MQSPNRPVKKAFELKKVIQTRWNPWVRAGSPGEGNYPQWPSGIIKPQYKPPLPHRQTYAAWFPPSLPPEPLVLYHVTPRELNSMRRDPPFARSKRFDSCHPLLYLEIERIIEEYNRLLGWVVMELAKNCFRFCITVHAHLLYFLFFSFLFFYCGGKKLFLFFDLKGLEICSTLWNLLSPQPQIQLNHCVPSK